MSMLGGTGPMGAVSLGLNGLNVLLNWQQYQDAKNLQKDLLDKAEKSLARTQASYDKYFPQMKSQAATAYEDARANTAALQQQNQANRNSALAEWANLTNNTVQGMDRDSRRMMAEYDYNAQRTQDQYAQDRAGILSGYDAWSLGLVNDYQNRLNTGMSYLEGQGEQGRRDILEQARLNGAAAQQQLAKQGFGGGQFTGAVATGQTREASNALNRLNEALGQQKFDAYSGLSKDMLGAKGDWITGRTGMQSDTANNLAASRENWLANRTTMDATNTQNRQKTQQAMQAEGFGLGQDYADKGMNLLAQEGADKAKYNDTLSTLLGQQRDAYAAANAGAANLYAGYQVEMPDLSGAIMNAANQAGAIGASTAQEKMQRRAQPNWWESWGSDVFSPVTTFGATWAGTKLGK